MYKAFFTLFLSLLYGVAYAEFVTRDFNSPGDRQLLLDTASNLEWLNLNQTTGLSNTEVEAELVVGGRFEGFRYATHFELDRLLTHANITNTYPSVTGEITPINGEVEQTKRLISFLGETNASAFVSASYGLFDNPGVTEGYHLYFRVAHFIQDNTTLSGSAGVRYLQPDGSSSPITGSFLIRDAKPYISFFPGNTEISNHTNFDFSIFVYAPGLDSHIQSVIATPKGIGIVQGNTYPPVDWTNLIVSCAVRGRLLTNYGTNTEIGQTYTCHNFNVSEWAQYSDTEITVTIGLSNGTQISESVVWYGVSKAIP